MRRVRVTLLLLALGAIFLSIPAWGGGMEILGVGARAKAMGGAFRAIANDWSAAYYNPAGLFYVSENQLTFNEVITHYRLKYQPNITADGYPLGFYDGEIRNRYEILTNPTMGGFFKLPIKGRDVVFGLSLFQPFDMNLSWQMFSPLNNNASLPGQQLEHNFDAVAINATAAVELVENKLSFGVSGGVLKGDLNYGSFFLRENPIDPNADYYDDLASRPNDIVTEWQKSDGDGLAPNLRAGLLFRPNARLTFGASYAFQSTITIDGSTYFYYYMPDVEYYTERNYPDSANYILSSGAVYEASGDFTTDVTMPAQLAAGVAYQLTDKLLVAGDLEYTFWSNFDGYAFDYTFSDSTITPNSRINDWAVKDLSVPVNWDNTLRGSIGLEYAYTDRVFLRAGYSADQTPVKTGTLHPAFFDSGLKHTANIGLGLVFENVQLDLATQYIYYPESTESGNKLIGNSNNLFDNMAGTYSGSAFESVVQFTVRF